MLAQDTRLARRVGAIGIGVLAAGAAFFVFLYPRIEWGSHVRVKVYFHATAGLLEGAPFVVGGRELGKVETIEFVPHGVSKLLAGDEGVVVTVAIDAGEVDLIDHGGDVFVASRGTFSAKYLEIAPPAQATRPLKAGDELVGRDPPSLDRVLQRTWDNLQTMGSFAADVKPELDALRARLHELQDTAGKLPAIDRFAELVVDTGADIDEVAKLRDVALGGPPGLARLGEVMDRARTTVGQARAGFAKLSAEAGRLGAAVDSLRGKLGTRGDQLIAQIDEAIDRTRAAIAKVDPLLAQIEALNASLAAGEGSLMKLANDPEFPEDAKELGKILKRHPWRVMDHP